MQDYSISSGEILLADEGTVFTGWGYLASILILTDGTNDATAIIYDNTAASGKKLWEGKVKGADNYGGRNWVKPVEFLIGMYVDLTGTDSSCIIERVLP